MQYYGYEDFEDENLIKTRTVAIKDINQLYQMADANLLEYLLNVTTNKDNSEKKVYIFKLVAPVQDELNSFYLGLNKKKNKRR